MYIHISHVHLMWIVLLLSSNIYRTIFVWSMLPLLDRDVLSFDFVQCVLSFYDNISLQVLTNTTTIYFKIHLLFQLWNNFSLDLKKWQVVWNLYSQKEQRKPLLSNISRYEIHTSKGNFVQSCVKFKLLSHCRNRQCIPCLIVWLT